MSDDTPKVYAAISAVMADLSKEGIAKTSRNQQQGYNFRGIDSLYNELSPILARNKLLMLPRVLSREIAERQTKSGGALFYTTLMVEFDLISADDGSRHTICTVGEAMDSADKSANKAMSAAYKYAAMQAFCIPTEGDNDADATTHEVAPKPAAELSKAKARSPYSELQTEVDACLTLEDLGTLWSSAPFQSELKTLPVDWQQQLWDRKELRKDELKGKAA